MKKLLVALVAMFCVTTVSAQLNNAGIRFDGGINVVGQYDLTKANYLDGRIGLANSTVYLTGLYNWQLMNFDWTPQDGKWFLDAGAGASVAFGQGFTAAVVGTVKFGFKFKSFPISLISDFTPGINLVGGVTFYPAGGFSVVYNF